MRSQLYEEKSFIVNCQWGFNDEQVRKAVRLHTANRVFVCDSQIHYEKKKLKTI
jgi:HD superfamily phosphohydrolase YqeK